MRVLTAINVLIWGGLAWIGWDLLQGVKSQQVAGYPNSGQFAYYLYTPLVVLLIAVAAYLLGRFARLRRTALTLHILALVFLGPFLLAYGGGM